MEETANAKTVDWNARAQTGMHIAMMFFFICLGVTTLKTIPVIHRIDAAVTDANRVILSMGGTAAQLRKASEEESKQLADVTTQLSTDLRELQTTLRTLNTTVAGIDNAVATTSQNINQQVSHIGPVLDETKQTVAAIQPSLTELQKALQGIAVVTTDPKVPLIVAHTEQTLANAESMTSDGAKVTRHYADMIFKPVSKVKAGLATAGRVLSWFIKLTL